MRLLEMRSPRGARIPALSADAAQLLLAYTWPGNIRELDNLLQRAMILANGPLIEAAHIRFENLREVPQRRATPRSSTSAASRCAVRCASPKGRSC